MAFTIPIRPTPGAPDATDSPLHRLEHALAPLVAFAIVPLFGFANAGIDLRGLTAAAIVTPLPLGIAAALFAGKQLGILGSIYALVRSGVADKPAGAHDDFMH